jgi:hypothetical protein
MALMFVWLRFEFGVNGLANGIEWLLYTDRRVITICFSLCPHSKMIISSSLAIRMLKLLGA